MISRFMSVFFRLFSVQGSWNYERLQGIGAAVSIEPLLRSLPGGRGGVKYREALSRAAQYFNTHPYFASIAAGAIARAENDGQTGEQVTRLHSALKAPLGSLGDQLVWAGVLPAASSLGLIVGLGIGPWWGVVTMLGTFNLVHLAIRLWGLPTGWRLGMSVGVALRHPVLQFGLRIARPMACLALGLALPLVAEWFVTGFEFAGRVGTAVVAAVAVVCLRWLFPTLGSVRLGGVAVLGALIVGWLWP
jgi:mannose PTS system EIID component